MRHTAEVIADCAVTPNEKALATVVLTQLSACRQCAQGRGCGAGLLAVGQNRVELQCLTEQSVLAGQRVTIETDDPGSEWLLIVLIAFGLPILGLAFGLVAGYGFSALTGLPENTQWPQALGVLLGLSGGVLAWRLVAPQVDQRAPAGCFDRIAHIVNIDSDS